MTTIRSVDGSAYWPNAMEYAHRLAEHSLIRTLGPLQFPSTRFGQPIGFVGTSAVVFKAEVGGTHMALRFLTRDPGGALRRAQIASSHELLPSALVIPRVVDDAIEVRAQSVPCLVSEWVDGKTLDVYIDELVEQQDNEQLRQLLSDWRSLVNTLTASSVAHCDLQHGNILVTDGHQLRLVDTDALWIDDVSSFQPDERGHENYQHPQFDPATHWGADADVFPALVIELGILIALCVPETWIVQRSKNEDRLVVGRNDFDDPDSEIWQILGSCPVQQVQDAAAAIHRLASADEPPARLEWERLAAYHTGESPIAVETPKYLLESRKARVLALEESQKRVLDESSTTWSPAAERDDVTESKTLTVADPSPTEPVATQIQEVSTRNGTVLRWFLIILVTSWLLVMLALVVT